MPQQQSARERAEAFCRRFGLRVPILQAPMAGASPIGLAAAVGNAGGMGALGALTTAPNGIAAWAEQFRGQSNGSFQVNLWVPDPEPVRDAEHEMRVRDFLGQWGPPVPPEVGDAKPLDFAMQCDALLAAAPLIALHDTLRAGRLHSGMTALLLQCGSGPAWAAACVRWGGGGLVEW